MEQQEPNDKTALVAEKSEEVTDIIERMPTDWTWLVSGVVTVIIFVAIVLGFIIKYPDTVSGPITITSEMSPVRIVAPSSGRLRLLVSNNSQVQTGQCLGFIENGACYEDVIKLEAICHLRLGLDTKLSLSPSLRLGSLSAPYNEFVMAYTQFEQVRHTESYENMRQALESQRKSSVDISKGLQRQIEINDEMQASVLDQYKGDSVLHHVGALSDEELGISKNKVLDGRKVGLDLRQTQRLKQAEMAAADIDLAKIDIEIREQLTTAFNAMQTKHGILCNEIRLWKERYLIVSPVNGRMEYLGFWKNDRFVTSSSELFSVTPAENPVVGEMTIPSEGAGKVTVGQKVNIRLTNYPYDEFGYVRGRVSMVSSITKNMEGSDGVARAYLVTVTLPDKVTTNYGKRLALVSELGGFGEIVTKRRRLIERLFDNIQAISDK